MHFIWIAQVAFGNDSQKDRGYLDFRQLGLDSLQDSFDLPGIRDMTTGIQSMEERHIRWGATLPEKMLQRCGIFHLSPVLLCWFACR